MRRADRLFQIVQLLRGGRLTTAARLSERLEVSERTVYRDIADLQASGVPVDGAAGVGYILRKGYDLPPLMFTRDELVALVAGARLARAWGGASMARAAEEALAKISAVVPEDARSRLSRIAIHAPGHRLGNEERALIDMIEAAVEARRVLGFSYVDEAGAATTRAMRPLGLWFWGGHWTVVGWCLLRADFRMFRLARMQATAETGETFKPEPGKTLMDFYRSMEREGHGMPT
ncbi:MAG: YafY family transcriptional regulator [Rhizobiaceae bacterium]|jgi:predicted DNA-binding transcriptional regulator YafY|nr:YafY family transcriptional regulator [Rhizobiaceae bacterium]